MSGNVVPGLSPEAQHASCVEGLKRAAELVEGKGVTLLLENIDLEENPHYYMWSVPEAFKIIDEVNHPQVKVLYDFYHAQISGGNLIANSKGMSTRWDWCTSPTFPAATSPAPEEINYLNIYRKLAELNYHHYVAMEFHPLAIPSNPCPRAAGSPASGASAANIGLFPWPGRCSSPELGETRRKHRS